MLKELRTHVYKSINQYGLNSYFKGKNISFRSQNKILLIVVYNNIFKVDTERLIKIVIDITLKICMQKERGIEMVTRILR